MTREDILEKSRKENKNMDEREQAVIVKSGNLSGSISIVVGCLIMIVNELASGSKLVTDAIWSVVFCSNTVLYGYQAYHLKKRSYWILTALMGVAGLVSIYTFLRATFGWG